MPHRDPWSDLTPLVVSVDPDVTRGYGHDQSMLTERHVPSVVLAPCTTADVAACMAHASRHGSPVVPRGAGSGLSGAANAPEGGVVLSTHRMTAIVSIDPVERLAVVQPGVITADLRAAVAEHGLYYPPDPGSVAISTIGGNVATNAGGMCCVKYGVTGDFVLGVEAVLADGRVMRTGRTTVKGVAGYDLTHLFVGSEGTLGVITEITLRLLPAPAEALTLVATFDTLTAAGAAVSGIVEAGLTVSALEILDRTTLQAVNNLAHMDVDTETEAMLLVQCDDQQAPQTLAEVRAVCDQHGAAEVAVADDPSEGAMLLEARRLALPALEQLGDWLLDDVCVPRSRIVDLIEFVHQVAAEESLTIGVFGHAGDGNMHPTVIYDAQDPASRAAALRAFDRITGQALELGGTITGEHGVGRLKTSWLTAEIDPVALDVHRRVKQAFDPQGLLNPGAVIGPATDQRSSMSS